MEEWSPAAVAIWCASDGGGRRPECAAALHAANVDGRQLTALAANQSSAANHNSCSVLVLRRQRTDDSRRVAAGPSWPTDIKTADQLALISAARKEWSRQHRQRLLARGNRNGVKAVATGLTMQRGTTEDSPECWDKCCTWYWLAVASILVVSGAVFLGWLWHDYDVAADLEAHAAVRAELLRSASHTDDLCLRYVPRT